MIDEMGEPHSAKTIARRIQEEVFGRGQLDLIDELYSDKLAPRVKELVGMLRTAFPDLTVVIDHLIAEDDKVACGWTATGTQRGWFFNIPPTAAQASWSGVSIYVVPADLGKVTEMAGNWDLFGLMNQLRAALG